MANENTLTSPRANGTSCNLHNVLDKSVRHCLVLDSDGWLFWYSLLSTPNPDPWFDADVGALVREGQRSFLAVKIANGTYRSSGITGAMAVVERGIEDFMTVTVSLIMSSTVLSVWSWDGKLAVARARSPPLVERKRRR